MYKGPHHPLHWLLMGVLLLEHSSTHLEDSPQMEHAILSIAWTQVCPYIVCTNPIANSVLSMSVNVCP